jgi:DGQHR domain-containing protein
MPAADDNLARRIKESTDPGIKRIGELLMSLEMSPRLVDEHIYDGTAQVGNIDLAFEHENRLLLIEVSKQRGDRNEKILASFQKWANPHHLELVQQRIGYHYPLKPYRIYVDLTRSTASPDLAPIPAALRDPSQDNAILFRDDVEYFEDVFSKVKIFALYDLLSYLAIRPKEFSHPIRAAVQFYLGKVYAVSFVISADTLLRSAYVFRRRGSGAGYQRFLNFKKILAIERKILKGNFLSFPNSVLINIERETRIDPRKPPEECPASCVLEFPVEYCSSRVIDGQHRLMGIARLPKELRVRIFLQVIAFTQLPLDQEVKTFVEINNNQTKVDKNLVLNLIGDFEWPAGSLEDSQKRAVVTARQLNEKRVLSIFFGTADERREEKVYLATLVTALVNNNLIGGKFDFWKGKEYDEISRILLRLRDPALKLSKDWRSFLLSNRGLRIILKIMYLLERNRLAGTTQLTNVRFVNLMKDISSSELLKDLTKSYGLGGASQAVQKILDILAKRFPDEIGDFTSNMRALRWRVPPLEIVKD